VSRLTSLQNQCILRKRFLKQNKHQDINISNQRRQNITESNHVIDITHAENKAQTPTQTTHAIKAAIFLLPAALK
jgi:hypothetical protein